MFFLTDIIKFYGFEINLAICAGVFMPANDNVQFRVLK